MCIRDRNEVGQLDRYHYWNKIKRDIKMANANMKQVSGIYHRRIGDVLVTAVSDGYIDAPYNVLQSISEDDAHDILTQ